MDRREPGAFASLEAWNGGNVDTMPSIPQVASWEFDSKQLYPKKYDI